MLQGQESTTTRAATINNTNDDIVNKAIDVAMEKLSAVKQEVAAFRSTQECLASEKADLECAVQALREEKTQLAIGIEKMKFELSDLGDQLAETQNEILEQAFTANRSWANISAEEVEVLEADDDDYLSNDDDGMLLDSQETILYYTQPSTHAEDNERVVKNTNAIDVVLDKENSQATGCINKYFDGDTMSVATAVTTSTTSTSSTTSSSSTKRRARKSYNSPKKWRRMIRTHRLQSICVSYNSRKSV